MIDEAIWIKHTYSDQWILTIFWRWGNNPIITQAVIESDLNNGIS